MFCLLHGCFCDSVCRSHTVGHLPSSAYLSYLFHIKFRVFCPVSNSSCLISLNLLSLCFHKSPDQLFTDSDLVDGRSLTSRNISYPWAPRALASWNTEDSRALTLPASLMSEQQRTLGCVPPGNWDSMSVPTNKRRPRGWPPCLSHCAFPGCTIRIL